MRKSARLNVFPSFFLSALVLCLPPAAAASSAPASPAAVLAASSTAANDVPATTPTGRWTPERARAWAGAQPWTLGCNYIPRTAVNTLRPEQKPGKLPVLVRLATTRMRAPLSSTRPRMAIRMAPPVYGALKRAPVP